MKYYIAENGQQAGPFEPNELLLHGLTVNSLVWCEGMPSWTSASQVPELMALLSGQPFNPGNVDMQLPPVPPVGNPMPQQVPPFGGQQQQQPITYGQPNLPYAQPQYGPNSSSPSRQVMPKTWLTESILVTVLVMQLIAKRKNRRNFLMLERAKEQNTLDMTISNEVENAVEVSRRIRGFCAENGVEETLSTILGVTAEELAVNAVKYVYKGNNDIDICLRLMDDKLVLRFRDNGAIFNPTEYIDDSGREVTGLSVVRSLTPDISYNRVLGFNVTVVSVNRKK